METYVYVDILLFISDIGNWCKHQYTKYIVKWQPEMIQGKQDGNPYGRKSVLSFAVRSQVSPEKQFFRYGAHQYIKEGIVYAGRDQYGFGKGI